MFIQKVLYRMTEESDWEPGWFVGRVADSTDSVILDNNYCPVETNSTKVWDCRPEPENEFSVFEASDTQ